MEPCEMEPSHLDCLFFLHLGVKFIPSWIDSLLKAIRVCCVTHQETCICNEQWLMARIVSLTEEHQDEKEKKKASKPKLLLSPAMVSPQVTSTLALNKLLLGCVEVHQTDVMSVFSVLMRVLLYSDTHSNVWTLQCQIQPLKSLHKKRKAALNLYTHTVTGLTPHCPSLWYLWDEKCRYTCLQTV